MGSQSRGSSALFVLWHSPPTPSWSAILYCRRGPLRDRDYLDQWYDPSATYFRVQSTEGKAYLLRYDEEADEWTLQSGFDGDELLTRPSIELVTVNADVIRRAEEQIEACEHCHPEDGEIPFDWLLAEVSGRRGAVEFVLTRTSALPEL